MPMSALALSTRRYCYADIRAPLAALREGAFETMPLSLRIFAENILRRARAQDAATLLGHVAARRRDVDLPYFPARVILQDLLGTPALVDLAALRDAVAERGGDATKVNPQVPVHLVIDHSVNVMQSGSPGALAANMAAEQRQNAERFEFFDWGRRAFSNVEIVPLGQGILHQINLERFSPVVIAEQRGETWWAYPDTLIGTDSHTTMINALGVLGWGVGGIEAEAVMLGRPIYLRLPEIVGVRLCGRPRPGVLATDIVLALTERFRAEGVVGAIIEFCGAGVNALSLGDRATISNMSPEFGSTASLFPIDANTLEYLQLTGRSAEQRELVEAYAKAQGLWADTLADAQYDRTLDIDLASITRSIAGPKDPHQRVPLAELKARGIAGATGERAATLEDGAVVIAAITSCTNTSNPRAMLAAGLLARNADARGLRPAPWVKTSLAPGSRSVLKYLRDAGLYAPLQALGFDVVGYGCSTCSGMSGPLAPAIDDEIQSRTLTVAAVLSGNRTFEGRIHPSVRDAFLASPPLVVAYAIAGSMKLDVENDALGVDRNGVPVFLRDIWPSDESLDAALRDHVQPRHFTAGYEVEIEMVEDGGARGKAPPQFGWHEDSTYIRRPPYWSENHGASPRLDRMRALALLGDNVTTDHISPAGAIPESSIAGRLLSAKGVAPDDFNSYGTRRGNHEILMRATFANPRLRNEMLPGVEGSLTRLHPEGTTLTIFEAAQTYTQRREPLIVVAGRNYGCGSSRDWAAKGPRLIGVSAIAAESFERIHRANLAGMGVLPLQFEPRTGRKSLELDGSERYSVKGVESGLAPRCTLILEIVREDGTQLEVPVTCRLDTDEEIAYFRAGGLLPMMCERMLSAA
ncbi:MAG TPA: aconitate hydratase AcnA [Burkholderiales bacterium]|nr:aconitate hydratase AcnA [Burkholderiales bacterium]